MSVSDPRELSSAPGGAPPTRGLGPVEPPRGDTVFIADASVEGEEVSNLLRARGYLVVDVPFALLDAQILSNPPKVLVLDVDQPRAVVLAQRALGSPSCARMVLFCVGDPLRADEIFGGNSTGQVSKENVFERPVDIQRLVERVCGVAVPSGLAVAARGTTPPPQHASRQSLVPPSSDSSPPLSELAGGAADALDVDAFLPSLDDAGSADLRTSLSPDLLAILDAAEARVAAFAERLNGGPISDEDPDCPVPAEMLAPLDEPLDALDDSPGTGSGIDGTGSLAGVTDGSAVGLRAIGSAATGSAGSAEIRGYPAPTSSSGGALPSPESSQRLNAFSENASDQGTGVGGPASAVGYPFSMLGPAGEDAPVRFQEARPVGEGRSAMARALEDRARAEPPPPTTAAQRQLPTGRPPGPSSTSEKRHSTSELQPFRMPTSSSFADAASPLAQSSGAVPANSFGTLTDRAALSSTDTSPRPRSVGGGAPLEPMHYPASKSAVAESGGRGGSVVDAYRTPITAGSGKSSNTAMPMVFAELEGARPLARAIASRYTGCLALLVDGIARRVVMQDGDVVTAASDGPDESLVAFLAERGDIDREVAPKLQSRLPPSGRHAGAALIAQGYLAQDELWPVLRAHAEWIIGKAIALGPGSIELDEDPPQRLRAEPSVFGGGTGAEVFVELMRRVVAPMVALARVGGPASRLDQGPRTTLLGECALRENEQLLVRSAAGRTVGEVSVEGGTDFVTVVWALVELGVLVAHRAADTTHEASREAPDPIDDEAIRLKVRARAALVREGDYFSLLGVARAATAYEIKRAYLELRRTFEPSRLLTARTVDLIDDVKLIVEVLDEAYDILRDPNRRERYRRAIEASPVM